MEDSESDSGGKLGRSLCRPYSPRIYLKCEMFGYYYFPYSDYESDEKDETVADIFRSLLRSCMYRLVDSNRLENKDLFEYKYNCMLWCIENKYEHGDPVMMMKIYNDMWRDNNDLEQYFCGVINRNNLTEIDKYVKLLLTYDKYNKLHILKHKTKLNNDIICDIIIKYL